MFFVYVQGVPKKFPTDSRLKKNTQKPGINVYLKDFWYTKINLSQNYIYIVSYLIICICLHKRNSRIELE